MKTLNTKNILFPVILLATIALQAQDKLVFNGYISSMGQSTFNTDSANWDATVHNRLNLTYYASDKFTLHLEARNLFVWGETMKNTPNYASNFEQDKGWVDLNFNWLKNPNNILNTQIDRAFAEYVNGNLEISIGRQRINWGRSLVWNPNDLFNAFSYYDFDYMERPGSDAIRAQYYTGMASSVEMVAKVDSGNNVTVAGLAKINKWGYDFQFLAGYANSEDIVVGAGWEGNIKAVGFRGEASYYHPENNISDTSGSFLATISFDYLWPHNLTTQAEFLYNDAKNTINLSDPRALYSSPSNSKSLSFSEYNFYGNIQWQALPILTINTAGMYYTDYDGYFLMPGVDLSLSDNLNFSLIYQYMSLKMEHPTLPFSKRIANNMAFVRLKWNF